MWMDVHSQALQHYNLYVCSIFKPVQLQISNALTTEMTICIMISLYEHTLTSKEHKLHSIIHFILAKVTGTNISAV